MVEWTVGYWISSKSGPGMAVEAVERWGLPQEKWAVNTTFWEPYFEIEILNFIEYKKNLLQIQPQSHSYRHSKIRP